MKGFLGNSNPSKMEVHDLHYSTTNCRIDEIVKASQTVGFYPDTLEQARKEGCDFTYIVSGI